MNRKFAFALLVLPFAALLLAPAPANAGVRLGLKAGVVTSQLGSDLTDLKWRSGAGGGASLALGLTPSVEIVPEVLWLRKGSTFTDNDVVIGGVDFGTVRTGIDLDYVTVPVLLRLRTAAPGPVNFMLVAGPTFAFKVNEKLGVSGLVDYSLDSDQVETFDFGAAVGAGLLGRTAGLNWTLEGRYEQGMTDVSKLPFGGELKNGSVQVFAGLEFPIL